MSAWDDYPWLADRARDYADHGAAAVLDEIDRLRSELRATRASRDLHVDTVRATELDTVRGIASANELLTEVLADEGVGHAADIQRVANEVGCSPAQALRMLVRYGVVRFDEFSDGPTSAPCVQVEAFEPR